MKSTTEERLIDLVFLGLLVVAVIMSCFDARAEGLKLENAPELDGEFCQQCYNGVCVKERCPNTTGSPFITLEAPPRVLPNVCYYTTQGWGYFEWIGGSGNNFFPCVPPSYIAITPTPKAKTK